MGLDLQQDAYRFQRLAFPPRQLINLGWKTSIFLFHFFLIKKKKNFAFKDLPVRTARNQGADVSAAIAVQSMKLTPASFAKIQKQDQEDSFPQTAQAFKIVPLGLRMCSVAC